VPALPSSILEPLWVQFAALLPTHHDAHPLGCHRPRIPDRLVFDKLIQFLVFGCGYRRIADHTCSAGLGPAPLLGAGDAARGRNGPGARRPRPGGPAGGGAVPDDGAYRVGGRRSRRCRSGNVDGGADAGLPVGPPGAGRRSARQSRQSRRAAGADVDWSRRGLTFDGSVDVSFVDRPLRDGVSGGVADLRRGRWRDPRRAAPAAGSGETPDPRWVQLAQLTGVAPAATY
jgi:hypothetical protein